jgi:hypothetical protein
VPTPPTQPDGQGGQHRPSRPAEQTRPTLNASVQRRRSDRAFYIRLAGAIRQNERALERLKR